MARFYTYYHPLLQLPSGYIQQHSRRTPYLCHLEADNTDTMCGGNIFTASSQSDQGLLALPRHVR